ncbi:MAG: peptide deformylase [Candidatus Cloacimonas sp.]|nr:peptide deformylase [Candidatus Cloacimonadota bacterium]
MSLKKSEQIADIQGVVLPIRIIGDKVLRRKAEPVTEINDDLRKIVADMIETMYVKDGVGLAAPQVGVSLRIFVIDTEWVATQQRNPMVFINPKFISTESVEEAEEGCLSLPDIVSEVKRALKVEIEAYDLEGNLKRYSSEGFFARAIQHEYDHLDGIVFTDRIGKVKLFRLKNQIKEFESKTDQNGNNFDYYHSD